MSTEQLALRLGRVVFEASVARQRGDRLAAAALHGEAVGLALSLQRWALGRAQAEQALALYEEAGAVEQAREARFGLALLDLRRGDAAGSEADLTALYDAFVTDGAHELAARSAHQLTGLALRRRDLDGALAWSERCTEAWADAGDTEEVVRALRSRTWLLQLIGRPHDAWITLGRAIEIGRELGDEDLDGVVLAMRLDMLLLCRHPIAGRGVAVESVDQVLAEAEASGDAELIAHAALARGSARVRAGDLVGGEADAERARMAALSARDPTSYLIACLVLAEVFEKTGRRQAVLSILFTCQASLGDLLGEPARVPVLIVLDSLRNRWGEAEFAAELERRRSGP